MPHHYADSSKPFSSRYARAFGEKENIMKNSARLTRLAVMLASLTMISGEAYCESIIFRDQLNRPDSQMLGCTEIGGCWVETGELFTNGQTPDGAQVAYPADILLKSGALTYHYSPLSGYHAQPYAYAATARGSATGTLSFSFNMGIATRVSHVVGVMTSVNGFVSDNPTTLRTRPMKGLGIQLASPCIPSSPSCIVFMKFDGVPSQLLTQPMALPFDYGDGRTYSLILTVGNDTVVATVSSDTQTVTASAPLNGFALLIDQIFVYDEQSTELSNGLQFDNFILTTPDARQVQIDIKPGSFPNAINLGSNGVVPVAILSDADFDATQVDPASVLLAGGSVKMIGKGEKYSCSVQDINADGWPDIVCQIQTDQVTLQEGDSTALLEARTVMGEVIRGSDSIKIVP